MNSETAISGDSNGGDTRTKASRFFKRVKDFSLALDTSEHEFTWRAIQSLQHQLNQALVQIAELERHVEEARHE